MITKVYVAGASKEIDRAKSVIAKLEAHDIHVVSTWPKVITSVGAPNPADATEEQFVEWTARDLAEVDEAAILALLLPAKGVETVGAYIELGWAAKGQKTIIMSGPHRPIFTPAMADIYCENDDALVDAIIARHRARVDNYVEARRESMEGSARANLTYLDKFGGQNTR